MMKIYLLLLTAFLTLPWASKLEAQVTYYSKAAATDFNDVNTWGTAADGTGTSPATISTADSFVVQNNSILTLNADAGIRHLTINAGTLTVSANTLTVEVPTQNNSKIIVTNGGQLNLLGGNVICNGAVYFANGSGFNQSGGLLKIDPNSGTAATSVGGVGNTAAKTFGIGYGADGIVTSTLTPAANVAKFTLTGGSIQIVDPPLTTSTTAYSVAVHTGTALNFGTGHTVKFGDGVSTQAAGSANGFYVYLWPGSSLGVLGNVEVDVLTGTNRWVKTTSNVGILGNLNIVSGEIWNTGTLYVNGNIVNNGIFTIGSALYFGNYFNATAAASPNAQTVTGPGIFRNSQTTITANATSLSVNNSNASGVTLLGTTNIGTQPTGSFSISSTLTFVAGKLNTTGTSVVLGVSSGTPSAGTLNYTAGGFTSGTLFGRSWTAAGTGTAIAAGTDPTTATSRFPFITASGGGRSAWIQRVTPTAAGITYIQYNESAGTTAVSIADGAYTATTRSNDNWVVSKTNADAATYNLVIVAPGVYVAGDNSSRVVRSADVVGTYQQGTITPGGQRISLSAADLVNTFYLAINNPNCLPPTALTNGLITTNSGAFSWTAPAPAPASGYEYYVSTSNTAPTAGTTPTGSTSAGVTNAVAGGLAANTLHYYWVRANCGAGDLSIWTGPGSFYTGYCVPAATSTATYINNFSTTGGSANISNLASGFTTGGYQDNYATMGATITAGSSLNFSLDYVGGTLGAAIWVDFNNNLIFESSERLYNTTAYTATATGTIGTSLAIPVTTLAGDYRMRVLVDYSASNPTNSCGFVSGRGEVEDYKISVLTQPTDAMDWVNLQFPATASITGGGSATVYTKGYEPGITDPAGAGAGIIVWIGISPAGAPASSDPATWTNWVPATFNVQSGNDDEFQAAIGGSLSVGTYQYASRWQLNGGPYRYGGYNATGGGFWDGINNVSGVLTVNPSANDNVCGAVSLSVSGNPTCTTSLTGQSTQYATQSLAGCLGTADEDVWYSFVATNTTHFITLTNSGSGSADRVHQLFSSSDNTCTGTLTSVNCSDPETSTVNGLTIGNTYFLRVYSWSSTNFATFDICITSPPACPAPTALSANTITSSGATINFTGTGTYILEYGLTGFTPGTGATAGVGGTIISPAISPQAITGLAASTGYSVYVRQDCTGSGNGYSTNATITFTTLAPPPANDDCATAVTIGATPTASTNNGATQTLAAGTCGGTATVTRDVWYQFTATTNGTAAVNVTGVVGFDPVIEAYSGACGSLTSMGCRDAGGTGVSEVLALNSLVAGQTYSVRVYNYSTNTGTFNISVTGAALPISIEYFKGSKQSSGHFLDWKVTCYNSPSVTMLLERSADGRKFTSINSQTETSLRCLQPFSFADAAPLAGINYYRLKSVDVDGKVTYSKIVTLLNKEKGFEIVSLVPNPVNTEAVLSVTSATKSIIEIVVSDLSGKQLNKQRVSLIAGNNLLPINVRNLPAGTYQVTGLTTDGVSRTLRFVKQ